MNLEDHIKLYIGLGWSVIPVDSRNKGGAPFAWKEFQERCAGIEEALSWWRRWPEYGIAIVTGGISNLVVADLDRHDGQDGVAVAEARFGLEASGPYVVTGGNGQHLYFLHPGFPVGNRTGVGALAPGVEIKGDGGFVYAPPSLHASGNSYSWEDPPWLDVAIPALPEWLLKTLQKSPPQASTAARAGLQAGVGAGTRNVTAAQIAGRYFAMGLGHDEVLVMLADWNRRNQEPLGDKELAGVVDSIYKREQAKQGATSDLDYTSDDDRKVILDAVNDVFWPSHKCRVETILRGTGENPIYVFQTSRGDVLVPAVKVGSQMIWRNSMIEATGQVPRTVSGRAAVTWDMWLQRMLDIAQDVDPGSEATLLGQVSMWLTSYLEKYPPAEPAEHGGEDLDRAEDPQMYDGKRHIHLGDFLIYIHGLFDRTIKHRDLAQRLALWGCYRRTFQIRQGEKRVCRSKWCIELALTDTENQGNPAPE